MDKKKFLFYFNCVFTLAVGATMVALGVQIKDIHVKQGRFERVKYEVSQKMIILGVIFIIAGLLRIANIQQKNLKYGINLGYKILTLTTFGCMLLSKFLIQKFNEDLFVTYFKTGFNEHFIKLKEFQIRNKSMYLFYHSGYVSCECPDYSYCSEEQLVLLKDKNECQLIQTTQPQGKRTFQKCQYFTQTVFLMKKDFFCYQRRLKINSIILVIVRQMKLYSFMIQLVVPLLQIDAFWILFIKLRVIYQIFFFFSSQLMLS